MNQNKIQKAIKTNNLLLFIDLRVEQNVRLEEIAPVISTLKERIGSLHTSATVAYSDKGQVKYINLPVYVTENTQERILHLFFPAPVQLSIWEANQEKTINFLEYHLDKRTQVVTEISGVADVNDHSSVIIIPIDFTKTYDEYSAEVQALATKYYLNKTLFSKPIYIKYIWKKDYTVIEEANEEYLVQGVIHPENNKKILFSSPCKIIEIDEPTISQAFNIEIFVRKEKIQVSFNAYTAPEILPDTFFLYADHSRVITLTDFDPDFGSSYWNKFQRALLIGKKPAVYLKTYDTDKYYPASYYFQWNEDKSDCAAGTMEIQYVKETNSKLHLCIDKMEFTSFGSGTYGPDDMTGENVTHYIQRIPLN